MTHATDRIARRAAAHAPRLFIEFRPAMRGLIEDAVESLLLLLDEIDGDADFEEDDPLEEDDPAEDIGDAEPSLGGLGAGSGYFDQAGWAQGARDDREDEHDGREPDEDGEPTLGATTALNQERAWRATDDGVARCDEEEPALGWTGVGRGHPSMALGGYDADREATTGPRDEEGGQDEDRSECPAHLPGGNGEWLPGGRG